MKILLLFIYSEDENYNKMRKIQQTYCNSDIDVRSYFVTYRKTQSTNVEIEDNMIYVKGEETYLGITRKTVEAIEYLLNKWSDTDYVVRTNISTVINIRELKSFCESLPRMHVYTGGLINHLQWLDNPSGIVDKSLWGTEYVSGTSIILSRDLADKMVREKSNIRHDIIDDVSIGLFMKDHTSLSNLIAKFAFVPDYFDTDLIDSKTVFYRIRTDNRKRDVENMQKICDKLYFQERDSVKREGFIDSATGNRRMIWSGIAFTPS
jgi:hypothetical protein